MLTSGGTDSELALFQLNSGSGLVPVLSMQLLLKSVILMYSQHAYIDLKIHGQQIFHRLGYEDAEDRI